MKNECHRYKKTSFFLSFFVFYKQENYFFIKNPYILITSLLFSIIFSAMYYYSFQVFQIRPLLEQDVVSFIAMTLFFCASLNSHNSMQREREDGALHSILLITQNPYALYIAKLLGQWQILMSFLFLSHIFCSFLLTGQVQNMQNIFLLAPAAAVLSSLNLLVALLYKNSLKTILAALILLPSSLPILILSLKLSYHYTQELPFIREFVTVLIITCMYCSLCAILFETSTQNKVIT